MDIFSQEKRQKTGQTQFQIAKDLAGNLSVTYNSTEVVMARLALTSDVKERVYSQALTFFGTNETVFTALNASLTSLQGLHESTETLNSMKEGINQSLETSGRGRGPGSGEGLAGWLRPALPSRWRASRNYSTR